ncbi:MAG: 6-phosphogluconolactonase [Candidatus Limnocylindrales bacterium]
MSSEPSIRVFNDPESAAAAAAETIAGALIDAVAKRGRTDWATTGGSAPIPMYRALMQPPLRDAVPWAAVHVWWGDDRYVPRGDPLSNVLPLDRELLPGVPLPPENVHAMRMDEAISGEAGPGAVASAYEAELRAAVLAVDEAGFPILDVVLVGIGSDGHVLSAFPGSPLFDEAGWVSPVPAPTHIEPHVARVSLHPAVLVATRLPVLVAYGAGKASILATVLGSERDERRWPAQVARREGAIWFLDRDAAAQLPR